MIKKNLHIYILFFFLITTFIGNPVSAETAKHISDTKEISGFVDQFFTGFYETIYLENRQFDLDKYIIPDSGFYRYTDSKMSILTERAQMGGIKTDFSVQINVYDIKQNELGYSVYAGISLDFKYQECDEWSGIGRNTICEVVQKDGSLYIASAYINDDIDSAIIGNYRLSGGLKSFDIQKNAEDWTDEEYSTTHIKALCDLKM
ncbi:MAG: hypothetical protein II936_06940 [Oscillospiraceae bacterium]|nr:hypothetical protein [Oscillospiraceae bacterium]